MLLNQVLLKVCKFHWTKNLCWILFFIKLQALKPATLLKRDSNNSILQGYLVHFLPSALKIFPSKNFLYFFLKKPASLKKFFLYFGRGIFRTLTSIELEAYSEHCQTLTIERFAKITTQRTFWLQSSKCFPKKSSCSSEKNLQGLPIFL